MPQDLFLPRSPSDDPHPHFPLPGPDPGTVALEEEDGDTQTYIVMEFNADVTDGRTTRRAAWGSDLKATLVVTESRLVFASTRMLKSYSGTKGLTFMGQIRYEDLAGLAGANYNAIKGANYLRLAVPSPESPEQSDGLFLITVKPGGPIYRPWRGRDLAIEIAHRATRRREALSGNTTQPFEETSLRNGGTGFVGLPVGDTWYAATKGFTTKGLGLLG
jgi:hypothetical protein